jgi:SAM-dependent methyltransferase
MTEPLPPQRTLDAEGVARLDAVYHQRFGEADALQKDELWKVICGYLQRFVPVDGTVLDLACDRGDFIRNIRAQERWGCDVRDVSEHLPPSVRFVQTDGLTITETLPHEHFDVVFMSNYLEHLPTGGHVVDQFRQVAAVLKPGGRVIVLQPNIKLVGNAYWDFIDHSVALTETSLIEAAELCGLETERLIKRFLPYTTKSRLPTSAKLAQLYLAFPPAWFLLGKQTLFVARRT